MKKSISTAAIFVGLLAPMTAIAQNANNRAVEMAQAPSLLHLSIERSAHVAPDMAILHVTITTKKPTGPEASDFVRARYEALLPIVRAAIVNQADIQTSELSVKLDDEPNYSRQAQAIEYEATIGMVLTVRDLRVLPGLYAQLTAIEGLDVDGPNFSISNREEITRQLRRQLLAGAVEEANEYADAANMRVLRVSEIGAEWARNIGLPPLIERQAMAVVDVRRPGTQIFAGQEEISVSDNFTFELVPK